MPNKPAPKSLAPRKRLKKAAPSQPKKSKFQIAVERVKKITFGLNELNNIFGVGEGIPRTGLQRTYTKKRVKRVPNRERNRRRAQSREARRRH